MIFALILNSRANSAMPKHVPLSTMNRMLPCAPVTPNSAFVHLFTISVIFEQTRESGTAMLFSS